MTVETPSTAEALRLANASTTAEVLRLANAIQEAAQRLAALRDESSPDDVLSEHEQLRQQLIGRMAHASRLLQNPIDYLKGLTQGGALDVGVVRALVLLGVPKAVPLTGGIPLEALAGTVKVDVSTLGRLLDYAGTLGLFTVSDEQLVRHSRLSAGLAQGTYAPIVEWDVTIPPVSALRLYEALRANGNCEGAERASFQFGMETNETFYEWHKANPKYAAFFRLGMESEKEDPRTAPQNLARIYDWTVFDGKTVIDLGGSTGHVARLVADKYPGIDWIIQDLPETIKPLPPSDRANMRFEEHDFFHTQPRSVDGYFLRYIFHNWADSDCRRILAGLKPALRPGARLLVAEMVQPVPTAAREDGWVEERLFTRRDMQMMSYVGAHERTVDEYRRLVDGVIPGLRFLGCHKPMGSTVGILEWIYTAE
ncbi:hypothetical protein ASPZODRAFT_17390 [Penicilliopsis zonata CBS 506.65]|uniref:O-methyltransferase C-terminal domain-containing protein n=1 Tax=Penicilliopsis zonata CBS 506.65 TaxID=1073090 RepID=A0A1L9SFG5_9EURO|nr:hypothetical protein ASPZODRAFT_17390 [Penicilliopsis zonata CBS 506.65]OJJ45960.1 hypothetical protein ASPZODRAFT_17390 [Penicilliopsis zonata CBS 506.65]